MLINNIVEKKINGVVYTAQFKGIAFALDLIEKSNETKSQLQFAEILFDEILISPKVGIDDFGSDMQKFLDVQDFLFDVATGGGKKKRTKAQLQKKVRENWACWRLLMSERGFDFQTVFGRPFMLPQDIEEANIALDMQIDAEKRATRKK